MGLGAAGWENCVWDGAVTVQVAMFSLVAM